MTNKEVMNIEAFTHWVKARFLNFKPQGVADFAESALFCAVSHSYYYSETTVAHLRQTCQLPFLG